MVHRSIQKAKDRLAKSARRACRKLWSSFLDILSESQNEACRGVHRRAVDGLFIKLNKTKQFARKEWCSQRALKKLVGSYCEVIMSS